MSPLCILNLLFGDNHNSLHLARKSDWMPLKCNFLPIRELPHLFASGSLTVAAIKWKQKAIGNLKRTILKTEKFILKANGFLKSSEVRPRRRWRRLFGCVNSRVLAWCFGMLCHGQMYPGILPPCYSRCTVPTPGRGKLSLWCKLWVTIDYITSSSPVIHIGRKKTLMEKLWNQALCKQFWWNLRLHKHRRERQIIDNPLTAILVSLDHF